MIYFIDWGLQVCLAWGHLVTQQFCLGLCACGAPLDPTHYTERGMATLAPGRPDDAGVGERVQVTELNFQQ